MNCNGRNELQLEIRYSLSPTAEVYLADLECSPVPISKGQLKEYKSSSISFGVGRFDTVYGRRFGNSSRFLYFIL